MVWLGIQLGVGSLVVLGSFLYQTGIRIAIVNYLAIIGTVVLLRTMLWWYYRGTKRRTTSSKTGSWFLSATGRAKERREKRRGYERI
jgi:hypothetical protein